MMLENANSAVIRVGDGRGFIVQADYNRLVITAAHCLPHFPPWQGGSYLEERAYAKLLAPLGKEPDVWAECLFVDPVGDIAVLCQPDSQELWQQAEAYDALVAERPNLSVRDVKPGDPGWLLTLGGRWSRCVLWHMNGPLMIENAADAIEPGMSGSPILSDEGAAVGVVCLSSSVEGEPHRQGGPNPRLTHNLPAGLLRALIDKPRSATARAQIAREAFDALDDLRSGRITPRDAGKKAMKSRKYLRRSRA